MSGRQRQKHDQTISISETHTGLDIPYQETDYASKNVTYHPVNDPNLSSNSTSYVVRDGVTYERRFPRDIHFSPEELNLSPTELYNRLLWKISWATQLTEQLEAECAKSRTQQKREWYCNQLILDKLMHKQVDVFEDQLRQRGQLTDVRKAAILAHMRSDLALCPKQSLKSPPQSPLSAHPIPHNHDAELVDSNFNSSLPLPGP